MAGTKKNTISDIERVTRAHIKIVSASPKFSARIPINSAPKEKKKKKVKV